MGTAPAAPFFPPLAPLPRCPARRSRRAQPAPLLTTVRSWGWGAEAAGNVLHCAGARTHRFPVRTFNATSVLRTNVTPGPPAVFSVDSETSAERVVADMLALKMDRLFVVDRNGILVSVIITLDVLRALAP